MDYNYYANAAADMLLRQQHVLALASHPDKYEFLWERDAQGYPILKIQAKC